MLGELWNWKSAILSVALRTPLFFMTSLGAGMVAATTAAATDAGFRVVMAGFFGALIQRLSRARRRGLATFATLLLVPASSHAIEIFVHARAGTPHFSMGVLVSVAVSILSSAFSLFAMRRGVFVVGRGSRPLVTDLAGLPSLLGQLGRTVARGTNSRGAVHNRSARL